MTIYLTQGRYTEQAIKGMVANPEDRKVAVKALVEAAGGTLIDYFVTLGEYDFFVIAEGDDIDFVGGLFAAAASGGVTDLRTTVAMTTADAQKAMEKAGEIVGSFKSAGS